MNEATVKLKEVHVTSGQNYIAASYPGPGLYFVKPDNKLFSVCGGCTLFLGTFPSFEDAASALGAEKEQGISISSGVVGIDPNVMLKALAIVQKPELAAELTK